MSEYKDLKRSLEEKDLLIKSIFNQYCVLNEERNATKVLMDEALVREKEKIEFIPVEMVLVRDAVRVPWRLANYVEPDINDGHYVRHLGHGGKTYYVFCKRPKDMEGVFIRHVGDKCPVSDDYADVILLLENGGVRRGLAGHFNWNPNGGIIGYVIIPKWALERVK